MRSPVAVAVRRRGEKDPRNFSRVREKLMSLVAGGRAGATSLRTIGEATSSSLAQSVSASVTRNTSGDQVDFRARSEKKKIYDAMAVASILNNSAGLDTSKDLVLPADALLHFISHYQGEQLTIEEAEHLVAQHEPHPELRRQHLLSFEGFARFLMDRDNEAIRKGPVGDFIYFILQYIIFYNI